VGAKVGSELASYFQRADVFVFPSRTDTFGLVLLEAMACGTPVAAFPVRGPHRRDQGSRVGILDEDLGAASMAALSARPRQGPALRRKYSWEAASGQFLSSLVASRSMEVPLVQAA